MKNKQHLDIEIAAWTNRSVKEVSYITSFFLRLLMKTIVEDGIAHVDGFGRFKLSSQRGSRPQIETLKKIENGKVIGEHRVAVDKKYTVTFSKARPFRQLIRARFGTAPVIEEIVMEKFGVDEGADQEQLEKKANEGCPECGKKPEKHGKVLMCPTHGSEPFETRA